MGADPEPSNRAMESPIDIFNEQAFMRDLANRPGSAEAFAEALRNADQGLENAFHAGASITALVRGRAQVVDTLLRHAWHQVHPPERSADRADKPASDLALIAVGGYGRGELHPHSDIDLLIVSRRPVTGPIQERIQRFVALLWDMGLKVGHSVRTLDACEVGSARDITVATNLMESRFLAGDARLARLLRALLQPAVVWPSGAFFKAKRTEQRARHTRFHDTAYRLEPNIKESPGGLRDIQTIAWVAKRHFRCDSLATLVEAGFLSPSEQAALQHGQYFLWRIRFALHLTAGRAEDRLLFDYQRQLAALFGYADDGKNLAVELFMQDYYRAVKELQRLNEILLQHLEEVIHRPPADGGLAINQRFRICHGYIEATDERVFERYPPALLELFLIYEQQPQAQGIRATTLRLLNRNLDRIDARFRRDPINRELFMAILRQPEGVTAALRYMNRYGVLGAYLPSFRSIEGRMQYDLFHIYTVDEHTLFVIRNLRRFMSPRHHGEEPEYEALIAEVPKPELILLAALFHDIAKGRGGDHSRLGADEARRFCQAHGLPKRDGELVAWLVEHHLSLSLTAQKQDISDPEVIGAFAETVRDRDHLNSLYLLTVADIRATNPELWNDWRAALLGQLFAATRQFLQDTTPERVSRRAVQTEDIDLRERIEEHLITEGFPRSAVQSLLTHLGSDYLQQRELREIIRHTRRILSSVPSESTTRAKEREGNGVGTGTATDPMVVDVAEHPDRGATELLIYAREQPYLFARLVAALERLGLSVVDARIHTTPDGCVLDTFLLLEQDGQHVDPGYRSYEIRERIRERLSAPRLDPPRRQRATKLRHFEVPTTVTVIADPRNDRSELRVIARDRAGLLSEVAERLAAHDVPILSAKINTLGERTDDLFFVTAPNGGPLSEAMSTELEADLEAALDGANGS